MGKNARHRKNIKKEKAKTKLKQKIQSKTKFLPKGKNVTNTSFKVKAIVLEDQLPSKSNDCVTQRNLTIPELLVRLKHHNDNMKLKACEDLFYLLKNPATQLNNHDVAQILKSLGTLFQCTYKKVRRGAAKLLSVILKKLQLNDASSIQALTVNLRCAMTHIKREIQEDSLLFLDQLLVQTPTLVAQNFDKLFPDFLMLISKYKTDSDLKRSLAMDLKSQHTNVAWQTDVLKRLYIFLKAAVDYQKNISERLDTVRGIHSIDPIPSWLTYRNWDALTNSQFDIFKIEDGNTSFAKASLYKHLKIIIPLLYEIWLEVAPSHKTQSGFAMTSETYCLLQCIINVLYLIHRHITKTDKSLMKELFLSNKGDKLLRNIIRNFPYDKSALDDSDVNNSLDKLWMRKVSNSDENLLICYLFFHVYTTEFFAPKKEEVLLIGAYLKKFLLRTFRYNAFDVKVLFLILNTLFIDKYSYWSKKKLDIEDLLSCTINLFFNDVFLTQNEFVKLFEILSNIESEKLIESGVYQNWLEQLPLLLCQHTVSHAAVEGLLAMSKKHHAAFHKSFNECLPELLDNLNTLEIIHARDNSQRILSQIFFFVKYEDIEDVKDLIRFASFAKDSEYPRLIKNILKLRTEYSSIMSEESKVDIVLV